MIDASIAGDRSRFVWSFGDIWSLELPIRGSGWREAEWNVEYLERSAASWKVESEATILFDLDEKIITLVQMIDLLKEKNTVTLI